MAELHPGTTDTSTISNNTCAELPKVNRYHMKVCLTTIGQTESEHEHTETQHDIMQSLMDADYQYKSHRTNLGTMWEKPRSLGYA